MILWLVVALIYGLVIGSFLNVVIWRLPRGGSIASPTWSYCPRCEHRLGAADLLPVLSFLALRARCRYCRAPISWRYPSVELLTGLLFSAVTWLTVLSNGFWYDAVFNCLFTAILICVFLIDLEHFIIPDGLSVVGALLGLVHGLLSHRFLESLAGFFGYAALIYTIGLLSYIWLVAVVDKRMSIGRAGGRYLRENAEDWLYVGASSLGFVIPPVGRWVEAHWGAPPPLEGFTAAEIEADEDAGGMGGGDGKLAAAIGANLGLSLALGSCLFAVGIGAFAGVIVMIRQRRKLGERTPIPFGPAMAMGALLALFFGHSLAVWYFGLTIPIAPKPPVIGARKSSTTIFTTLGTFNLSQSSSNSYTCIR